MPLNRHRAIAWILVLVAVLVLALTGVLFHQGRTPGLYPERSWGPWKSETMGAWSTHVRTNSWVPAAQARVHYGKAEDVYLDAFGGTDHDTSVFFRTAFTLTPDGSLTVEETRP
ncbi:hypothetical protein OS965_04295 [Streptomyces sp. H27-G5]|uniref:hypothetical protein n=1 Tax=Streptomyces sp. H27-G5 TaxID=2996698 RepID=UPI00226E471D|nr:hypothetical protein [Streptomyces sp. H27-G5]MCY0917400.1 hypothetical protein [Streptomyces sp. H27-G5]